MFLHEDEGVTIAINPNRADKAKTREILELALAHLDDRKNGE